MERADAVRNSTRISVAVSLGVAGAFFAVARATGSPPVAQAGGALWVFLLSLLVALPLITPAIRKRAARYDTKGG